MKELNDYERGFIECFIDTDGSISIYKRKNRPGQVVMVQFINTNLDLLLKVQNILDGAGSIYKKKRQKDHYKDCYMLTCTQGTVRWLFPQIKLVDKEDKRLKALDTVGSIRMTDISVEEFHKLQSAPL